MTCKYCCAALNKFLLKHPEAAEIWYIALHSYRIYNTLAPPLRRDLEKETVIVLTLLETAYFVRGASNRTPFNLTARSVFASDYVR